MAKSGSEMAAFEKLIHVVNSTLCQTNTFVSPDGNIYKKNGDTYTILTTIDIFIGMFLSPGRCQSLLMASIFADYGVKLKGLLMSPFQRLIHNRYPKVYMPDNHDLQCLAKVARHEIKEVDSFKIDIC